MWLIRTISSAPSKPVILSLATINRINSAAKPPQAKLAPNSSVAVNLARHCRLVYPRKNAPTDLSYSSGRFTGLIIVKKYCT